MSISFNYTSIMKIKNANLKLIVLVYNQIFSRIEWDLYYFVKLVSVSLFNVISTFVGYLIPKLSL